MKKSESVEVYVRGICKRARAVSRELARLSPEKKESVLLEGAAAIRRSRQSIQEANQRDLEAGREKGLAESFLDRLELTDARIEKMAVGLEEIAAQRDPIGEVVAQWRRPGGFEVGQVRIPLGVVAMIYESRPNVTADAAALCFKAGNATILRGGSEAIHSNRSIAGVLEEALVSHDIDPAAVQLIETTDRSAVGVLLEQSEFVDVIIPRGGKGLIRRVVEESTIPVIKHYEGICHVYVDEEADLEQALSITVNAKVQRPGTCNAMETLLVHREVAAEFLPRLAGEFSQHRVKIRGCPRTSALIEVAGEATEEDFRTEYLSLECNIRVVDGLEQAVEHIEAYGSNHTDAIVTRSYRTARHFVALVDSSSVIVNASPRLADGGVYGLGAEIGISTDKLHAYGPMGVEGLTSKKFVVYGDGNLRD